MAKIGLLQVLQLQDKKRWNYHTLDENLARCYDKNLYVDAELKVQDKTFPVHRSILCFHSPVLRKAFYSKEVPATTCTITEIKPEGFEILLRLLRGYRDLYRYLYTSEIPNAWKSCDLVEACYAAHILQMLEIKEKLIHHILYRPRVGDRYSGKTIAQLQFWPLLEMCRFLGFGELQEKLLKFAESNFTSLCDSYDFVEADIETIKLVFDRKFPSVPQKYVVENLARWVAANDHLVFLDEYVKELLKCVDLKRLSTKEFYAIASKHNRLLSKNDALDIQMHLVDPTVYPLPKWYQLDHKEITQTHTQPPGSVYDSTRQAFECGQTWQESFYQMLNEGLFTDVTLLAEGNAKIPAHSLILALQSEFFADVLYYNAAPHSKILCMEETAEELKDLLRYFYGSGTESVSGRSLGSILRKTDMALKYLCYPLMQICNDALLRITLNPKNFWTLTGWVGRLSHCKVNGAILMRYAATSTKQIFEHNSFLKASKASLVRVLKSDYLNMAEVDILEHVARWMEKNATQLPTDSSKKKLLKNIRFDYLVPEQFSSFLEKHDGIFPSQDSSAVMKFLCRRSEENPLPAWCYRGPRRSVFYLPSMKIGTNVPVHASGSLQMGKNWLRCSYTVAIRDKGPESMIQFLELSLNFESLNCTPDCSCSVTIMIDSLYLPRTFQDLNIFHQQRYLLPVCFRLDKSYSKSFKLVITVDSKHSHNFFSVGKRALKFDSVTILPKSSRMNCLCDAIVDGFTSENVPIPPHVLSENKNKAVKTEKCFEVTPWLYGK